MSEGPTLADNTLGNLTIEGSGISSNVAAAITKATLNRTIEGASTITLDINDPHKTFLKSPLCTKRTTMQLDGRSYECVAPQKSGTTTTVVFEDLLIAEMRRHDEPLKVAGGTMTRIDFARRLLSEIPWAVLTVNPHVHEEMAKEELARGTVAEAATSGSSSGSSGSVDPNYFNGSSSAAASPTTKVRKHQAIAEDREDTWTCLQRIFSEVNWRCYVDGNQVCVGPDYAFLDQGTVITLEEYKDGCDSIDFDYDTGKTTVTVTANVRAHRWQAGPGTPIGVAGVGPADGVYIVSEIEMELGKNEATITLKSPEAELPEPDPPPEAGSIDAGLDGSYFGDLGDLGGIGGSASGAEGDVSAGVGSGGGPNVFYWPLKGAHTITSPFGQRARNNHQGVDLACSTGTPVYASQAGVVTNAYNDPSGYGLVIYIKHSGGYETRYGHLSKFLVQRGVTVQAGAQIAKSGATGDATGPHLHFELRLNGVARNPVPFLSTPGASFTPSSGKSSGGGGGAGAS